MVTLMVISIWGVAERQDAKGLLAGPHLIEASRGRHYVAVWLTALVKQLRIMGSNPSQPPSLRWAEERVFSAITKVLVACARV